MIWWMVRKRIEGMIDSKMDKLRDDLIAHFACNPDNEASIPWETRYNRELRKRGKPPKYRGFGT